MNTLEMLCSEDCTAEDIMAVKNRRFTRNAVNTAVRKLRRKKLLRKCFGYFMYYFSATFLIGLMIMTVICTIAGALFLTGKIGG